MAKTLSERIDENVCLYKFTGVFHKYIYYNSNGTDFVVRTPWIITYHNKIKNSLKENNKITIYDDNEENDNKWEEKRCDWIVRTHYDEWLVSKGSVFISNDNYDSKAAGSAIGVRALDDNYPVTEMLLVVFGSILGFVLIIFIQVSCSMSRGRSQSHYTST